jgi:3-methyladenine DNA glycosylase AlkD
LPIKVLTPKQLAAKTRARLKTLGDPLVVSRGLTFFKEGDDVSLYGIKCSAMRRIEKEVSQQVRKAWTVEQAIAFCDLMVRDPHVEAKSVGFLLLGRYRHDFERGLLKTVHSWIAAGCCPNWATTDGLAPTLITPLLIRYPDLAGQVMRWTSSPDIWLRRAALVTFVPLARKGDLLEQSYSAAQAVLSDREDLIHKACGWLLRECGRTDMPRLERFLLRHGPGIPRTALRNAIERFPQTRRKRLLEQTR